MLRTGSALGIPERCQFAVFLTPDGRRPKSGDPTHWKTISYREVAAAFKRLLPEITSVKTGNVLHDWIEVVSVFGGV